MKSDTLLDASHHALKLARRLHRFFMQNGQVGWDSTEYIVSRPKRPLFGDFAYSCVRSDHFRNFAAHSMTSSGERQLIAVESLWHLGRSR